MSRLLVALAVLLASVVVTPNSARAAAPAPAAAPDAGTAEKPLTFGIQSPLNAKNGRDDGYQLEGYLGQALHRPVKAKTFNDYDDLSDALAKGTVDVAWITPLSYVK